GSRRRAGLVAAVEAERRVVARTLELAGLGVVVDGAAEVRAHGRERVQLTVTLDDPGRADLDVRGAVPGVDLIGIDVDLDRYGAERLARSDDHEGVATGDHGGVVGEWPQHRAQGRRDDDGRESGPDRRGADFEKGPTAVGIGRGGRRRGVAHDRARILAQSFRELLLICLASTRSRYDGRAVLRSPVLAMLLAASLAGL